MVVQSLQFSSTHQPQLTCIMVSSTSSKTGTQSTIPQLPRDLVDSKGDQVYIPDFPYLQLLKSIPKHCFERSAILGLGDVLCDIGCLIANFYFYHDVITTGLVFSLPTPFKLAILFVYTFVKGFFCNWYLDHCSRMWMEFIPTLSPRAYKSCPTCLLFSSLHLAGSASQVANLIEQECFAFPASRDSVAISDVTGRVYHTCVFQFEQLQEDPNTTKCGLQYQSVGGQSLKEIYKLPHWLEGTSWLDNHTWRSHE